MAGAAIAPNLDEGEKGVLIAVDAHLQEPLDLARRVPLPPEFSARAGPVMDDSGVERRLQRRGVHMCDHKDVAALRVEGHAGRKPVDAEFRQEGEPFFVFGAVGHPYRPSLDFGGERSYIGGARFRASVSVMIDDIYNKKVLELAANIPRLGRLSDPDATAKAHSRLCGSTVTIDLKVRDGRVTDFAHDVKACALGQASSSLMARHVIGASADDLFDLRDTMTKMLKANGPPPSGKWSDFAVLEPVRNFRARHASTLLTFDAVAEALGKLGFGKRVEPATAAR